MRTIVETQARCLMVLVDTSVWIRFLANKSPSMVELKTLLDREEVAGHELVFGELLIGDKGGRKAVLSEYSHIRWMPTIPHRELATFV